MRGEPDPVRAVPGSITALSARPVPRILLCFASGVFAGLGHVPFGLPGVALGGLLVGFLLVGTTSRWQRGFLTGWWMGVGYFATTLFWIVEPFQVDVARHGWMAPFALLFVSVGFALFWGAAAAVAVAWSQGPAGRLAAFVASFGLMELARGYILTGFPWALIGYIWTESGVRGWASLVGSYGLGLLSLSIVALAAAAVLGIQRKWTIGALAGVAVLFFAVGPRLLPPEQDLQGRPLVRLIQPNAPQHEKWDPDKVFIFLDRQIEFTGAVPDGAAPDLIVWPETSIPFLLERADNTLARISAAAGGTPVIVGAQRRDGPKAHNSLALITSGGQIAAVYDKHHLVPFGEYMPLRSLSQRLGLRGVAELVGGGYWPGPGAEVIDLGAVGVALPLICYEAIFPQDVHAAPERPDFLLQITNDAWFGNFAGPYQHLAQARMRSVEQGLPMARSANTGVSAMIDPAGRVLAEVPLNTAGFVDIALPAPERATPYSRTGEWPVLIGLIVALLATFAVRLTVRD